ncbi:MAG: cobalt-precorrin-5B (C(1))-methyltransferase [Deltaproteobacteria bacterium]|nr:cobalt-precorrin-5B (C(1))-methyltransferase [Deltaproteobacteria bacterium]
MKTEPKKLRWGFSTGTAAAAAAAAALYELLGHGCPQMIEIPLPGGQRLAVPISRHARPRAGVGKGVVVKDGGDDPDVTHGAEIGARVWRLNSRGGGEELRLLGGEGVGRVTKPGLPVAVGEPAINPVPRRMLRQTLKEIWEQFASAAPLRLGVEIFVPRGEELARQTLNPRLGILGGISILGTTGLVKPFSHGAYRATIHAALKVARAEGIEHVVLTPGRESEDCARRLLPSLPEEAFVQMGDYVGYVLGQAGRFRFRRVTVAAFFGKALKMAQGLRNTHASKGPVDLGLLGRWTAEITGSQELAGAAAEANTARQALEVLLTAGAGAVVARVGEVMLAHLRTWAGPGLKLEAVILDPAGQVLWQGESSGG